MFTNRCFIRKNTPELREKLETLGYRICICCKFKDNIWLNNYINDELDRYEIHGLGEGTIEGSQEAALNLFLYENAAHKNPAIDCSTNENLFLAIAALRDDKPDYQWFLWEHDGEYHPEDPNSWKQYIPGEKWEEWWWFEVRKATVDELIEHFNK